MNKRQMLSEGRPVSNISIPPLVRCKAYPNAAYGKGILEYTPRDQKAIDELNRLIALVYQTDAQEKANGYR